MNIKIFPFSMLKHFNDTSTIVHCHGCFDPLHIGHIKHFQAAKKLGDLLVVTVTPDRFINKGPNRPVFSEDLRAEAIAALACVDLVVINEYPTAVEAIKELRPHIYVKGGEYKNLNTRAVIAEAEAVESVGGRIEFTDELTFSSTKLLETMSC